MVLKWIHPPVHERMREDPGVVGVCRPGHPHVFTAGVVAENTCQGLGPAARLNDGIIIDLVEVVTPVFVRFLYQLAHHPRRCVLFSYPRGMKRDVMSEKNDAHGISAHVGNRVESTSGTEQVQTIKVWDAM